MKNLFAFFWGVILLNTNLKAQPSLDKLNQQVNYKVCGTDSIHTQMLATDSIYRNKNEDFEKLMLEKKKQLSQGKKQIINIPIKVYVLNPGDTLGGGVNLTNEQFMQGLATINSIFAQKSSDTSKVLFELVLVKKSENETGEIIRLDLTKNIKYKKYGVALKFKYGLSYKKLTALHNKDSSSLLNIYIVNEIDNSNCTDNNGYYTSGFSSFNLFENDVVMPVCSFRDKSNEVFSVQLYQLLELYFSNKKLLQQYQNQDTLVTFDYFFETTLKSK